MFGGEPQDDDVAEFVESGPQIVITETTRNGSDPVTSSALGQVSALRG